MRRPLVLFFLSMVLGLIVGYMLNTVASIVTSIAIMAVSVFIAKKYYITKNICIPDHSVNSGRKVLCIILCSVFFYIGMTSLVYSRSCFEMASEKLPCEVSVTGTVFSFSSQPGTYGGMKYDFILEDRKGTRYSTVWYSDEILENLNGVTCTVSGYAEKPSESSNPRTFNYSLYLKSKGISTILKAETLEYSMEKYDNFLLKMLNHVTNLRNDFIEYMDKNLDSSTSGMLKGILFGMKDEIDDNVYVQFQENGTAHLLATSGLHMGVIYAFMLKLFGNRLSILSSLVFSFILFCYVAMADFNPSIMRAYIMIVTSIAGRVLFRKYDMLSSIALSAMLILFVRPYNLFNAGFQMSYLAIALLAVILKKISSVEKRGYFVNSVLPVIAIQIGMSVYIAYNFNYFSFSSFFANIPVTALASWCLIGTMGLMVLYSIGISIHEIIWNITENMTELMMKLNSMTHADGKFTITVTSPSERSLVLLYLLFFIISYEDFQILLIRKKIKQVVCIIIVAITISCGIGMGCSTGFEKCNAVFVDVGQGSCAIFTSKDGNTLMVDGGGKPDYNVGEKILKSYLLKNGIDHIDYAVVTHRDTDHYKGICELSACGMIEKVITGSSNRPYETEMARELSISAENIIYIEKFSKMEFGSDLKTVFFSAGETIPGEEMDENAKSLVFKVILENTEFLITGDIDTDTEERLVRQFGKKLNCDIIQVPHHGSNDSSSDIFIKAVAPYAAVIQTGKNSYGHPSANVIEKYQEKGIMVYRTDNDGAVGICVEAKGITKIVTMKNNKEK